jgi:hypothetical protein
MDGKQERGGLARLEQGQVAGFARSWAIRQVSLLRLELALYI